MVLVLEGRDQLRGHGPERVPRPPPNRGDAQLVVFNGHDAAVEDLGRKRGAGDHHVGGHGRTEFPVLKSKSGNPKIGLNAHVRKRPGKCGVRRATHALNGHGAVINKFAKHMIE